MHGAPSTSGTGKLSAAGFLSRLSKNQAEPEDDGKDEDIYLSPGRSQVMKVPHPVNIKHLSV